MALVLDNRLDHIAALLAGAVQSAKAQPFRESATILAECWAACDGLVDKPDGFDDLVNELIDCPNAPEGHYFAGLHHAKQAIKMECESITAIRDGKVRPPETEPKHTFKNIDELRASLYTDVANAERLRGLFGKELRHVTGLDWLDWTGTHWQPNGKAAHERAAYLGTAIKDEFRAGGSDDPDEAKAAYSWARKSESAGGIAATLKVAEHHKELNGDGIEWDADKWALNTPSGTINLRTGKWRMHRREDYLTTLSPTRYNPDATAPRFEKFLSQVFAGDEALMRYLQWAVGYSLTGDTSAQVFFLLHGVGANGKSTLLDVLRHVLGPDYFHGLNFETLLMQRQAQHQSPLAQLRGKRLVMASEAGEGRKLNTAMIKSLTGGDPIRANLMHRDATEFIPQCKIWLLCNHKPVVGDDSLGMWRRVRLLPFLQSFTGDKADPRLGDALKAEAEGVLAWAVRGAMMHAEHGEPDLPECVRAATEEYRIESDSIGQFLAECCEDADDARQGRTELFEAFKAWGGRGTRKDFADSIKAKGYGDAKLNDGKKAWRGMRLVTRRDGRNDEN